MKKRIKKGQHLICKYFYTVYSLDEELVASFDLESDLATYLGCRRETIDEYFCKYKSNHIKIKKHIVYRELNEEYANPNTIKIYL